MNASPNSERGLSFDFFGTSRAIRVESLSTKVFCLGQAGPVGRMLTNEPKSETEKDVDVEQSLPSPKPTHESAEGEPATEEELRDLFHVVDDIPIGVWLAAFVASTERFTWFGATGPLR